MKEFTYTVTAPEGLHARPAGQLVQKVKGYAGCVTLYAGDKSCEATRLMALMAMCIKCGTPVRVTVEGADEQAWAEELERFFKENL